jgi:hypothetical protein
MKGSPSNGTGAETNDRPLALKPEVQNHPSKSTVMQTVSARSAKQLHRVLDFATDPTLPAKLVLNAAMPAFRLAAKVDPALKPSHPTQRSTVPRTT